MKNQFYAHPGASIQQILESASQYLDQSDVFFGHGTDNAWDESVALLFWVMAFDSDPGKEALVLKIDASQAEKFSRAINQRVGEKIPAAYITGEAWFCELKFQIDERALIPRSPISELIQNDYHPWISERPKNILDLCCGSGCIGLAAAIYDEQVRVTLADLSEEALVLARQNIQRYKLEDRVKVCQGDLFEAVGQETFDLILSNPPYVDADDLANMPQEYRFEPEMGLGSGVDGLDITRRILSSAPKYLTDNGLLILEVGNSWVNLERAFPQFPFTPGLPSPTEGRVFLLRRDKSWSLARFKSTSLLNALKGSSSPFV